MRLSLEAMLEVDKLIEAKQASNASIVNQGPLEQLKDTQAKEEPEEDIETQDTEDVSSEESDTEEFNDAVESLSNIQYDISAESWDDVKQYSSHALSILTDSSKYLGMLGITYTPIIASKLYTGVSFVISKLIKHLFSSIYIVTKYIERRTNSINTLKNSITGLKHTVEQIKQSPDSVDLDEFKYSQESTINDLKIGDSVDFVANLTILHTFLSDTILNIDTHIQNDVAAIRHLITSVTSGKAILPNKVLGVEKLSNSMIEGEVNGVINDNELLNLTHYKDVLPGDILFIALTPKELSNEIDEINKAYNHSKLFFTVNTMGYVKISTINHMTIDELSDFINTLDKLCIVCEEHEKLYKSIKELKLKLRFSFRDYFKLLINNSAKVSIKDSLVNLVYLKTIFIDKVYLVAAMDIHDYTAKTISSGISLAKEHVKRLQ